MDISVTVGEYITDAYGIYKVTEIKEAKDDKGKINSLVYFQTAVKGDKTIMTHIPLANLRKAGLRKLISSEEATAVIKNILTTTLLPEFDPIRAKEEFYQNNIDKTIPILYFLWTNQATMSKIEKDLMWQIVDNLVREISFVTKEDASTTKEKLLHKLSKVAPVPEKV